MHHRSGGTRGYSPLKPTLFTEMKKNSKEIKHFNSPTELQQQSSSKKGLISNKGKWPFALNYQLFSWSLFTRKIFVPS